jgi:DNA-binding CsgD family transcriptional regulator
VKIAKRKISKQARYWSAQKRDWERLGNDDVEHLSADERQDSEHACFKMFEELEKVLTPRQLVIVKLLLEGYSQAKIGEKLGFSEKTVNREILKIRERLNDMREEDGDGIES